MPLDPIPYNVVCLNAEAGKHSLLADKTRMPRAHAAGNIRAPRTDISVFARELVVDGQLSRQVAECVSDKPVLVLSSRDRSDRRLQRRRVFQRKFSLAEARTVLC